VIAPHEVSEMDWLNKTWSKKPVVAGLLLHFGAWWALFAWGWGKSWGVPYWLFTFAPLYEGLRFVRFDYYRVLAIENIGAFIALTSLAALAVSTRRRWLVLLAHLTVVFYWLSAAVLIGVTTG